MANAVEDKLTKEGERLLAELKVLTSNSVKIGFQSGEAFEKTKDGADGADICEIAVYNELGTETIPSRPFMRDSIDKHEEEIVNFASERVKDLTKNKCTAEGVLNEVGIFEKGIVQWEIANGDFAPNAPSTIRKKKSDRPLIDTGTMRQSVNYIVTKDK